MQIDTDFSDIRDEFSRLKDLPGLKGKAYLDQALDNYYTMVLVPTVHKRTGSLALSAKKKSSTNKATHNWTGTISLGGTSPGVFKRVDYAIYEFNRGGSHNFFSTRRTFEIQMRLTMARLLKGTGI